MEQEKKRSGIIIVLVILVIILAVLCVLFATGTISLKSNETGNNQTSENTNNNTSEAINNTKEDLNSDELNELNTFFDVYKNEGRSNENVSIEMVKFNNPEDLLNKTDENSKNGYYLAIAIIGCKYSQLLSTNGVGSYLITLDGIEKLLKDLTNYDYKEDDIKDYFESYYKGDKDAYVFGIPGGLPMSGTINSSYKIGNKYYITLSNNIDVVLQKINNQYYFYSSTGWSE